MTDAYEVGKPPSGTISTPRCAKIGQQFRSLKLGTHINTHIHNTQHNKHGDFASLPYFIIHSGITAKYQSRNKGH